MKWILLAFFASLLFGQVTAISILPPAYLYVHDVILVFLCGISFWKLKNKSMGRLTLIKPIGVFVFVGFLSLVINSFRFPVPVLAISSLYLWRWAAYAGLYVFVMLYPYSGEFWMGSVYATGVGFALIGFVQYVWYPDLRNLFYLGLDPHYQRLFSSLFDPNFAGILFVLTFFLYLAFPKKVQMQWYMIGSQILVGVALLLTYSRSSYLAFVVGIVVWVFVTKRWKIGALFILLFAGIIVALPKDGEGRKLDRIVSTIARVDNWRQSTELIKASPVIGFGFNTLGYIRKNTDDSSVPSRATSFIDSSLLFVWATTGIVGLIAYCFLVVRMIVLGVLLRKRKIFALSAAYFAIIASLGVHSLFVNSLFYPWVMIFWWTITGVVEREATADR